jgi:hypothetical protein
VRKLLASAFLFAAAVPQIISGPGAVPGGILNSVQVNSPLGSLGGDGGFTYVGSGSVTVGQSGVFAGHITFISSSSPPTAISGNIRLGNGGASYVAWRNAANSGDLFLVPNTSDQLTFAGSGVCIATGTNCPVTSVFGRTGAVVAAANDYAFSQLSGTASDTQLANAYSGTGACGSHTWASTLTRNAAPTCTQPAFSDLSGITSVDLTAQQASITATTIVTPGANGFYIIKVTIVISQVATTSSTLPRVDLTYTDPDSSVSHLIPLTQTVASNTLGAFGFSAADSAGNGQPVWAFYAKSGTAIQYDTVGYASSGVTPMQYALHIRLEGPF